MGQSSTAVARDAIEKQGNQLPRSASRCTGIFHVEVAKLRWPRKTAAHWAAAAGVKARMVKYWMAGTYPVSDSGKLALIRELE